MKKNRLVLPVLILLFILITPCAVYGTYVVVSKKIAGENPNHLHKFNGKLYYYDENDNLLGSYECQTEICDTATSSIDDEYLNYADGQDYTLDTFGDFVFIKDGEEIFMYSLPTSVKLSKISSIKTYGKKLNSKYVIMQMEDGHYVLYDKEAAVFNLSLENKYTYIGISERFLNEGEETMILAVQKDGMYYIADAKNNIKSNGYNYPIYDYDYRYVICVNDGKYYLYDYEKNPVLSYFGYDKASAYYDHYVTLSGSQVNVYKTEISSLVKTYNYPGRNIDYVIENNVLSIKEGEVVLDSYEFSVE